MEGVHSSGRKAPKITILPEDEALFIALRLAKAGYYGGDPSKVLKAPIDIVLRTVEYEAFENNYNAALQKMSEG